MSGSGRRIDARHSHAEDLDFRRARRRRRVAHADAAHALCAGVRHLHGHRPHRRRPGHAHARARWCGRPSSPACSRPATASWTSASARRRPCSSGCAGSAAHGGIAITASHNPAEWNALKFIGPDALFLSGARGRELLDIYHQGEYRRVAGGDMREIERPAGRARPARCGRSSTPSACCHGAGGRRLRVALDSVQRRRIGRDAEADRGARSGRRHDLHDTGRARSRGLPSRRPKTCRRSATW